MFLRHGFVRYSFLSYGFLHYGILRHGLSDFYFTNSKSKCAVIVGHEIWKNRIVTKKHNVKRHVNAKRHNT